MVIFDPNFELIKSLQSLNGLSFQLATESILASRFSDFQTVPRTPGDGGLDGISHNFTAVYCCYGLDLTSVKGKAKQRSSVVEKFKKDLNKLIEVEVKKGSGMKYENKTLRGILGINAKIKVVYLLCNWFEDNTIIGTLRDHFEQYKKLSELKFITHDCSLVFTGPKEIVRDYEISTEIRLSLVNPVLSNILSKIEQDFDSKVAIESTSEFDSKFETLYKSNPSKTEQVDGLKSKMLSDWGKQISLRISLEEEQPSSSKAISDIVVYATGEAQKLSLSEKPAIDIMSALKEGLKSKIKLKFKDFSDDFIDRIADYIVASLVGICPLDWRN